MNQFKSNHSPKEEDQKNDEIPTSFRRHIAHAGVAGVYAV